MAIDLIVQHIRELLKNRNGNGNQQQHLQQQSPEEEDGALVQQIEASGKRNRHNSDSFFTRPH